MDDQRNGQSEKDAKIQVKVAGCPIEENMQPTDIENLNKSCDTWIEQKINRDCDTWIEQKVNRDCDTWIEQKINIYRQ